MPPVLFLRQWFAHKCRVTLCFMKHLLEILERKLPNQLRVPNWAVTIKPSWTSSRSSVVRVEIARLAVVGIPTGVEPGPKLVVFACMKYTTGYWGHSF